MTNGKKGSKFLSYEVRVGGGAEASELYYKGLLKESAMQGDVREGVKRIVGVEVRGVRNVRWNGCPLTATSVFFSLVPGPVDRQLYSLIIVCIKSSGFSFCLRTLAVAVTAERN